MEDNLYKCIKAISTNIKQDDICINSIITKICSSLNVDAILINENGYIISQVINKINPLSIKSFDNTFKLEEQVISQLSGIYENKINISLDNLYTTLIDKQTLKKMIGIFLPLYSNKERLGMLIIYKEKKLPDDIDMFCEYISSILSIMLKNEKFIKDSTKKRDILCVKSSISTLSYSELEAIVAIFTNIESNNTTLVASKIADEIGVTRSVVVNALRKFESAGIIETRSLGMKGTHIKIINKYIIQEIKKFKN